MKKLTGIIDVGIGNISSVGRMIEKVGGEPALIQQPNQLIKFKKVILPGVGHFDEGMKRLKSKGFSELIFDLVIQKQIQILGICLGMQILCRCSEEGDFPGLGLIDADVKKFSLPTTSKLKVPHMGWNIVSITRPNPLLPVCEYEQRFYFVHSYKVVPDDPVNIIGVANYGGEFCAAFHKGNVFGVQFHPEKSHRFGMMLMHRFIEL